MIGKATAAARENFLARKSVANLTVGGDDGRVDDLLDDVLFQLADALVEDRAILSDKVLLSELIGDQNQLAFEARGALDRALKQIGGEFGDVLVWPGLPKGVLAVEPSKLRREGTPSDGHLYRVAMISGAAAAALICFALINDPTARMISPSVAPDRLPFDGDATSAAPSIRQSATEHPFVVRRQASSLPTEAQPVLQFPWLKVSFVRDAAIGLQQFAESPAIDVSTLMGSNYYELAYLLPSFGPIAASTRSPVYRVESTQQTEYDFGTQVVWSPAPVLNSWGDFNINGYSEKGHDVAVIGKQ